MESLEDVNEVVHTPDPAFVESTNVWAFMQAHGIEDQSDFNPQSRINDGDLVEGGQLLFLELDYD